MIKVKDDVLVNPKLVFKVVKFDVAGHYELNIYTAPGIYENIDYGNNKEKRDEIYDVFYYTR